MGNLWPKEEISQLGMEQVVNLFMVKNSKMRTLSKNTQAEDIYQWQMQDQTQMAHNSSCVSSKPHGLMENMLYSAKPSMDLRFLMLLNQLVHKLDKPKHLASLLTVA